MQIGAAPAGSDDDAVIDVCVCTYQRSPQLRRLIESLAAQRDAPKFRVVIADNNAAPAEAEQVAALARRLQLPMLHIHAPAANIAIARNRCLEHARAPLLAFIDDDEIADPDWLAQLHAGLHSLDAVFGPVHAQYTDAVPDWMIRGDFHSKRPVLRRDGSCDTGYTANVLLRRHCIGTHRFLPHLGRSGGEDTMFFATLQRDGARLGFCAAAVAREPVVPTRAEFGWLCRRAYGSGQAHARVLSMRKQPPLLVIPVAALKLGWCVLATLANLWSATRWRHLVLRGSLHLGVIATAAGAADVEFYGNSNATGT